MWWSSAGADNGCLGPGIHMYQFCNFCVVAFWGTTVVFALYVSEMWYFKRQKQAKETNEKRLADLEKKIQQDETGFKGVTPDGRGGRRGGSTRGGRERSLL